MISLVKVQVDISVFKKYITQSLRINISKNSLFFFYFRESIPLIDLTSELFNPLT